MSLRVARTSPAVEQHMSQRVARTSPAVEQQHMSLALAEQHIALAAHTPVSEQHKSQLAARTQLKVENTPVMAARTVAALAWPQAPWRTVARQHKLVAHMRTAP